ncbi:MAG: YfiR family protein [Candidatus Eisenbacteria bacterium]
MDSKEKHKQAGYCRTGNAVILPMTVARRVVSAITLALLVNLVCGTAVFAQSASQEYGIKAAFLFNFAKFATWPEDTFESDTDSFVIAVVGKNPFGNNLAQTLTVKDRKIQVKEMVAVDTKARINALKNCHLVYVSPSEKDNVDSILALLRELPILTVSDVKGFSTRGGMIELVTVGKRIRFDVNMKPARASGVELSSKLLRLARTVTDEKQKE